MLLVLGSCERCLGLSLVSEDDCIDGKTLCPDCGGLIHLSPERSYPEGDVTLFDALVTAVDTAGMNGEEAGRLREELEREGAGGFDLTEVLALTSFSPTLRAISPLLAANPARLRRAFVMLRDILHVRASFRQSGFVSRAGAEELPEEEREVASTPGRG